MKVTENQGTQAGQSNQSQRTPRYDYRLRRASGTGFGRGQLLVRMNLRDRKSPLIVQEAFLPEGFDAKLTRPWEHRVVDASPDHRKPWETYCLAEVAYAGATTPAFILYRLDGTVVQNWRPFDWNMFIMDKETELHLAILVGIAAKKPAPFSEPRQASQQHRNHRAQYHGRRIGTHWKPRQSKGARSHAELVAA